MAREIWVSLELVAEDRRRLAPPRLPGVERREEQVRADERQRGSRPARATSGFALARASGGAVPSALTRRSLVSAQRRAAGARGRRDARRRPPRMTRASLSSCSAGASGIVTTSSSARVDSIAISTSSVVPSTGTPCTRRRRSRGLSSRKPTTWTSRRPASVASEAAARLSRPDDEDPTPTVVRAAAHLGHEPDEPAGDAASAAATRRRRGRRRPGSPRGRGSRRRSRTRRGSRGRTRARSRARSRAVA